jgi:murein DD-endopeptidase MepM/ murein hydrolase activator NlpD
VADTERGSIALLVVLGGGLLLFAALVPLVAVADVLITRGRAQQAADAAALAAMAAAADPRDAAERLADANGADLLDCCGGDPRRRQVTVAVTPASRAVAAVVPRVRARAAAAFVTPVTRLPGATVGVSSPAMVGGRAWPVQAPLTSGFGMRTHPLTGAGRLHAGIDLGARLGTPIRAAAAGVVTAAGPMGGYGATVDLRHADGTVTRYAHQSRVLVRPAQRVAVGQVIGLVGSTGASTGPHLHFEVRTASGPVDPRSWLP